VPSRHSASAGRGAQAGQDRGDPGGGPGDLADAGSDLGQVGLAAAALGVVGADIDRDQQHVPVVGAQEGIRVREL
jgi:hypothetical protein